LHIETVRGRRRKTRRNNYQLLQLLFPLTFLQPIKGGVIKYLKQWNLERYHTVHLSYELKSQVFGILSIEKIDNGK
jgi:hypothetical protein